MISYINNTVCLKLINSTYSSKELIVSFSARNLLFRAFADFLFLLFWFDDCSRGIDWGGEPGQNCYNQTTLIEDPNYWGSDCRKSIMKVIGEVFGRSKTPITLLNITQMSNYRKDAHTSIYKKQWSPLTAEQLENPTSYADCVHWCLPGLQDTWNELLFAKLFYP